MAPGGGPGGGEGGNIKVVVRVRPFNGREMDRGAQCIVEMKDNQTILTPPPDAVEKGGKGASKDGGNKVFAFDRSYWSFDKSAPNYAGQQNLHDDLGKPLLDNAFQGYNNCIFAYGQTGSGKSYSMMGYGKDAGIIPSICQDMFGRIGHLQEDKNLRCTVEVSYLEIYNERVRDLLNPANKGNLKVREHPSTGPYVEDLAKLVVGSFQEIEHLMDEGNKARTVAATNMNETSSRSHAVFTLMLTQKRFDPDTKMEMEKAAKISLVDLAGSERATSTGATGARLKEGAEINRSLSTLGRVIAALADLSTGGKKKKGVGATQVPYRDSVLTWLLKDSLGGNSMTAMIAAISPADINYDETLSTLRYADSAKRIKNHAVINEDANARMIRELKEELAMLKSKLTSGSGGGGPGGAGGGTPVPSEEVYAEGTPLEQQIVSITRSDGSVKKVSKAEIAEQLNQSEKILQDLNQTWEQKMQKTEEIHKEREAALEELGISIEKGFIGLSTPKKMPHLVNLSDDPLLAECLVYNLKPGSTTVGNVESNADHQCNIRLNGTRILHEHCVFENAPDGTVMLVPKEGAAVMVNGKRVTEPKRLHSGYRIILGDFHIFRFNHPTEARAERAEKAEERQSLLRQSVTASQLQALENNRMSGTPSPTPLSHERSFSLATSEVGDGTSGSRPDSPAPVRRSRESDWSFARREAAPAILGTDQNFAKLTDEELNALFEDVQRARAERVVNTGREADEDAESMASSYPVREKYMSVGTNDNLSFYTALTMPSTPKQVAGEGEDAQNDEFRDQLETADAAEVEEIRREKAKMEETLERLKADMQKQLDAQKRKYEQQMERLDPLKRPRRAKPKTLTEEEMARARDVARHWRSRRFVQMAETVLQHAATLKEAQIMSHELEESVAFQFAVIDVGHSMCSTYDMVLNGVSGEDGDDLALDRGPKPCVGVRVVDYKHTVAHLWSLEKLHDRVRQMRQMHQYLDQPEYAKHLSLDNPFVETCMPQYTLIGEADVPLRSVFGRRVQDFALDVLSPHSWQAVGIVKLALEPSSARAPKDMLKFNVVMHEMVGFAEREGTEVHAQLYMPNMSDLETGSGLTTTQMIKDFDEGPIRFESVHSISVPLSAPKETTFLRVAIFAKVSAMHLDRLLSWDDMRDGGSGQLLGQNGGNNGAAPPRINETHFLTAEKHDVLARIQILEIDENGEYVPVEVTQTSELDAGTFQLHQGLQRRVAIQLTHSCSGDAVPWDEVTAMRVGKVQLIDSAGKTPDMGSTTPDLPLRMASGGAQFRSNANGTKTVAMAAQWDSSLHNSLLLNRVTQADKYRVQMTVSWDISSAKLAEPMRFSMPVCCQVLSRSFVRQKKKRSAGGMMGTGMMIVSGLLGQHVRILKSSTAVFTLQLRPAPIRRVGELWRASSQHDYVKGEEKLAAWAPRGVSLIADFLGSRRRRRTAAEIGSAHGFLRKIGCLPDMDSGGKARTGDGGEEGEEGVDRLMLPPRRSSDADEIEELLRDSPEPSEAACSREGSEQPEDPEESQANGEAVPVQLNGVAEADSPAQEAENEPPVQASTQPAHTPGADTKPDTKPLNDYTEQQAELLERCLSLWKRYPDPMSRILSPAHTGPPADGIIVDGNKATNGMPKTNTGPDNPSSDLQRNPRNPSEADDSTASSPDHLDETARPEFVATVVRVHKNPTVLKGGYLLVPSADSTRWIRRFVELRRPYLHIHSVTDGEEVAVVGLRNARIDSQPGILGLLGISNGEENRGVEGGDMGGSNYGDDTTSVSNFGGEDSEQPHPPQQDGTALATGIVYSSSSRSSSRSRNGGNSSVSGNNSNSRRPSQSLHRRTGSERLMSSVGGFLSNGYGFIGSRGSGGSGGSGAASPARVPSVGHGSGANRGSMTRLSERLQAGVFAVYGTDNTWLFAARSERDKLDWISRIDQVYAGLDGSVSARAY